MGPVTQEDPIGIAGGLNLYGYANGDPINFSDPFGPCLPEDDNEEDCPVRAEASGDAEAGSETGNEGRYGRLKHSGAESSMRWLGW